MDRPTTDGLPGATTNPDCGDWMDYATKLGAFTDDLEAQLLTCKSIYTDVCAALDETDSM